MAAVGEEFELPPLDETGGTGFLWTVVDLPAGLELVATRHRPKSDAPGAAGRRHFRLKAVSPGQFVVRMELRRPWEHEARDERVLEVSVESR